MQTKSLGIVAIATVVAVVAIAAVAFGPGNLAGLMNRTPTSTDPRTTPQVESTINTPTWHVGDTWTYNMSRPANMEIPLGGNALFESGKLTRTVVSATATEYNVSVQGSFHITDLIDPTTDVPGKGVMLPARMTLDNATVTGYAWYRVSDLAKLKDSRTVKVWSTVWTEAGMANVSYIATVETTYSPALDLWSFPINENKTWNATTNATIHAWIKWRADGPNWYWEFGRNFTATVPVSLVLVSGMAESVTTPAGTFSAIPVRVFVRWPIPRDDHADMAMNLGNDEAMEHQAPAALWFSGTAKGLVQATLTIRGIQVEAVLVSYHVA